MARDQVEAAVGERVRARVFAVMPFGLFVETDGQPDGLGMVEVTTSLPGSELTAIGAYLDLVVVDHADHNWQVRLRQRRKRLSD